MLFNLTEKYPEVVTGIDVQEFRHLGTARSLVAAITFVDESKLHIRDYTFPDETRKYSYHWQDRLGNLIRRWDCSPHHQQISTFPHHEHDAKGNVTASTIFTLDKVMEFIASKLN